MLYYLRAVGLFRFVSHAQRLLLGFLVFCFRLFSTFFNLSSKLPTQKNRFKPPSQTLSKSTRPNPCSNFPTELPHRHTLSPNSDFPVLRGLVLHFPLVPLFFRAPTTSFRPPYSAGFSLFSPSLSSFPSLPPITLLVPPYSAGFSPIYLYY